MKICFLAPANSIHSHRWIKYFVDQGHEVHWISFHPLGVPKIEAAFFYEIKQSSPRILGLSFLVMRVRKLIHSIKPDVVHIHSVALYGLGTLVGFHPFVATAWGSDILNAKDSWLRRKYVQHILNKTDLITCDANHMIDTMTKIGTDTKKLRLIYFGTDTKKFSPNEHSEGLKKMLGLPNVPTVLSLRNFYPVYDIESLIRAIPAVLQEIPRVEFVIIGSGPEEQTLKELCFSLGVNEHVIFTGKIDNQNLPKYLSASDVYVSTSLSDAGLAASTAEAMASGLPVVVTDSGENREWVKDGENGFIVPVKSPQKLAEQITQLLKNPEMREKLGTNGRHLIESKNDYYKEMKKMEALYKELITRA